MEGADPVSNHAGRGHRGQASNNSMQLMVLRRAPQLMLNVERITTPARSARATVHLLRYSNERVAPADSVFCRDCLSFCLGCRAMVFLLKHLLFGAFTALSFLSADLFSLLLTSTGGSKQEPLHFIQKALSGQISICPLRSFCLAAGD